MIYKILFCDYETFSLVDLQEVGIDNYARHPSTGISMMGWALDDEDVDIWLPHQGPMPEKLLNALLNPAIIKIAWNASFEYNITNKVAFRNIIGRYIPMQEFRDPMVLAHNLSLPGKLEKVAIILKMANQKDPRGDELKFMFCQPVSKGGEMTLFGIAPPLFRDHISHPREFAEYVEYCFTPNHTLLGENLQWAPASHFRIGEVVLGFDEQGPSRKFKPATIEKISYANEFVYEVTLASGHSFHVTADHQWLTCRKRVGSGCQSLQWMKTKNLVTASARKNGTCSHVPRVLKTWSPDQSYDAGWVSGISDGEGTCNGRTISVAQKPGPVLERLKTIIQEKGFDFTEHDHVGCKNIIIKGGKGESLRFLGTFNPIRLKSKISFAALGRMEARLGADAIISVRPAGILKIIKIQTNTSTLLVDGYPMHNCKQDVRAERALWHRMLKIGFPEREWQGWLLDQKINEFGMPGRRDLAEKGLRLALRFIKDQKELCKKLTGLKNPNSDVQMKAWITERGYPWNSLRAPTVAAEFANPASKMTSECREALKARTSARKSSYTKIEKFLSLLSTDDDRLRNQFRYMGAARTGRWASGGGEDASVQVQNLPRGAKAVKKRLDFALQLLEAEDYDGIVREFTNTKNPKDSITVVDFVITLMRSLFQAKPGKKLIVADLNAIENRVLGWMAGCDAILDVFRHTKEDGGDPYLAFGTKLYNKSYAEMWAAYAAGNEEDRQNSKPAVLGAGYGLGGGEMYTNEYGDEVRGGLWGYALAVCGTDMPKELAHKAVKVFRESYPEVVQLWTDSEEAFKQVLKHGGVVKVGEVTWDKHAREWVKHPTKGQQCIITFRRIKMEDGGYLMRVKLPSGRALHYLNATIEEEERISKKTGNPYTSQTIYYDGIEHSGTQDADGKNVTKRHKWGRVKSYGAKLVENFDQAISRDILLHGMLEADDLGFHLFGLFHDELACEEDDVWDGLTLGDLIWCMCQVPSWANGLMLGAEGYTSKVYKKG